MNYKMPVPFSVNVRASAHQSLRSKLQTKYPKTLAFLLSLDNLGKCFICKDCNSMGSEYYRWIGWFSNDDQSYFEIFDVGENEPFSWVDGETKYGFLFREVEGNEHTKKNVVDSHKDFIITNSILILEGNRH
jgi:hypothetical protein